MKKIILIILLSLLNGCNGIKSSTVPVQMDTTGKITPVDRNVCEIPANAISCYYTLDPLGVRIEMFATGWEILGYGTATDQDEITIHSIGGRPNSRGDHKTVRFKFAKENFHGAYLMTAHGKISIPQGGISQ